jgi:hypothetical protein
MNKKELLIALASAPEDAKIVVLCPADHEYNYDFESLCCDITRVNVTKAVDVSNIGLSDLAQAYYTINENQSLIEEVEGYLEINNIKDITPEQWIENNLEWKNFIFIICDYQSI